MRSASVIAAVVSAAVVVVGGLGGCKKQHDPAPITERYADDFERAEIGDDYRVTGGQYQIANGALGTRGAYNHPLWLKRELPRDVVIELDAWSTTPDGDIKVEVFGDGKSHAKNKGAYTATGYVFVMGGWSNSKSILARMDEHGEVGVDLVERTAPRVEAGKRYHFKIVRRGGEVEWFVDDMETPFLSFSDPAPLEGEGHEHFGFNNWESDSWFDNLVIRPAM